MSNSNKNKKYKIVRSNYTIKKVHKRLDGDRTIYERDYAVLNDVGTWKPGEINALGSPTFKMVHNDEKKNVKKHGYGDWVKPSCDSGVSENWTLDCVNQLDNNDTENNIQIKPNYTSLLSFSYFGSCVDLIRTSFNNLINNFPSELCFIEGYPINPMEIDVYTNDDGTLTDNLKKISSSYYCYEAIDIDGKTYDITSCNITPNPKLKKCPNKDDSIANCILSYSGRTVNIETKSDGNGGYYYESTTLNGLRIRPKKEYIKKKISNLSEFERYIVNRDSYPIYTMMLDFPHETDEGVKTYLKKFTLPSVKGWNPNIQSNEFDSYYRALLEVAEFYDSRQTGNLWRAMTHDSIKNMDFTYKKISSNDDIDDFNDGTTKMQKIINAFGRQLDTIKLYADNVKYINNVSYNGNFSMPDYFLSDKLENSGWEVTSVSPSLNNTITCKIVDKIHTSSSANIQFMKNLLLNSKQILSHKGTRHGVEMLLSLFGLKSKTQDIQNYNYEISEYIYTTNKYTDGCDDSGKTIEITSATTHENNDVFNTEKYNSWKKNYESVGEFGEDDTLQGLPLNIVVLDDNRKYLVPWFDKKIDIDGSPYFENSGGWMKIPQKLVKNVVNGGEVVITGTTIYNRSENTINISKNIYELTNLMDDEIYDDIVYYVEDISNFDDIYEKKIDESTEQSVVNLLNTEEKTENEQPSNEVINTHYFILKNKKYSFCAGYFEGKEEQLGWRNIPQSEFNNDNLSEDATKVLLMESMVDSNIGNKPHYGANYDSGDSYKNLFKKIFSYSIDNENFHDIAYDCNTNELNSGITNCGFDLSSVTNNTKIHYFTDKGVKKYNEQPSTEDSSGSTDNSGSTEDDKSKLSKTTKVDENKTPSTEDENISEEVEYDDYKPSTTIWDNNVEMKFHDFESGTTNNRESAAYSIINTKKMTIKFYKSSFNDTENVGDVETAQTEDSGNENNTTNAKIDIGYEYIINKIIPFLEQMIPSTTILEVKYE